MIIQISQLFHYPVKSMAGMQLSQMLLDSFGPKWDRRFILIDQLGRIVTQRQCPTMGQIAAKMMGEQLCLSHGGVGKSLSLDEIRQFDRYRQVSVWKAEVNARMIEHDINQWISEILQRQVTLCFMDENSHRQLNLEFARQGDRTGFADCFPFLIMSEASLGFLSEQLGRKLAIERFRPNIVVSGCGAFAEDEWKKIAINGIEFEIVMPCGRCVIPTLDLETSEQQADVMQVMMKHRKQGRAVMVGQYAIHRDTGLLQVGQGVEVVSGA